MENIRRRNKMIETYSLLLIDMISVLVAYWLALVLRFDLIKEIYPKGYHSTVGAYILILCLLYTLFFDGNRDFFGRKNWRELFCTARYTAVIMLGLVLVLYLTQQAYEFSRLIYAIFFVTNTVITFVAHIIFKKFMLNYYKKSNSNTKMMVLTIDMLGSEVINKFKKENAWDRDITAVAFYDTDKQGTTCEGVPVVASKDDLFDVVCQMMVDEVFICLPGVPMLEIREMVTKFEEMGLVCHYNVDIFSHYTPNTTVQQMAGYSVISFTLKTMDSRKLLVKRLIDIVGSLVGIIITCIITPFVALAIKIDSPGPVFFSQTRIGKNGRRFKIWKFRSMYIDAEERKKELEAQNEVKGLMFKMEHDPRITKVGNFIRKTSIDETPQFFNIFLGDMSLVGTRPPTEDEFEQYNGYYRRRMSITTGLTGMWQVSGRSDIQDFEEIVKLDLEYIDNWSLALDIKILFMTVYTVLARKGSK